jgi:hypothetical protein
MKKRSTCISGRNADECTEIVADDFQHTICMDAGSAESAAAIFSHSIHGDKNEK